ncbi:hypothetical protein L596_023162 [Steinernema carpocapsae]|uniref:Peptidase metallopeptidase domain-containing protein n=1 Tax=Steinernema carpocapsae TaxID=34508 RepID=A0A4U5MCU7_STECR|nr:hypothetical protein L596_023162 [Steinernema carpocapsae]
MDLRLFVVLVILLTLGVAHRYRRHHKKLSRVSRSNQDRWEKHALTYWVKNTPSSIPDLRVIRQELGEAFRLWSQVTNLTFTEAMNPDDADIVLSFELQEHGDGYPFYDDDLAHAFGPGRHHLNGKVHFNNDFNFKVGPFSTQQHREFGEYDIRLVATHHIGHALGLQHNDHNEDSVMHATYRHVVNHDNVLTNDDISAIQALYGAQHAEPPVPVPSRARRSHDYEMDQSGDTADYAPEED